VSGLLPPCSGDRPCGQPCRSAVSKSFTGILRKVKFAATAALLSHSMGHDARLIPAQFVKPLVKSNKNDFLDAEAIAEAVDRENMRFVPIKTDDQLDWQALHRVRERLVSRRTSVINQVRAFLLEAIARIPSQNGTASTNSSWMVGFTSTIRRPRKAESLWRCLSGNWKTGSGRPSGLARTANRAKP